MAERLEQLKQWLSHGVGLPAFEIEPASGDASFRRYFRVSFAGETRIAMDAPPPQEDIRPFMRIAEQLAAIGLNVPQIEAREPDRGFLLLSDLGSRLYLSELNEESVERLYGDALGALMTLQACGPGADELPPYDETLLRREMALFRDWLVGRHLGLRLSDSEASMLDAAFDLLAANALGQPQVTVHRDYHSRNLMVHGEQNPGILDFQDAVFGPLTYDLVSLLRDCYIAWPRARVEEWVLGFHELALQSGVLRDHDEALFLRWFDLMGVQRQMKASGIFARLNHRDGKPGYLADVPRTLGYLVDVAGRYPELHALGDFVESRVLPGLAAG